MPKISKVRAKVTKPKDPSEEEERKDFYCCKCGRHFIKQRNNFTMSQSPLYKGNNGYVPVCNACIDELYQHYRRVLENDMEATKRLCMKFDIYWAPEIFNSTEKNSAGAASSRIRTYIGRSNVFKYAGKTYDDTVDEEYTKKLAREKALQTEDVEGITGLAEKEGVTVDPEIIEFWGTGFEPSFYLELDRKYKQWTKGLPKNIDKGEEAIYKQVCILEATINRDSAAGKPIEKNVSTLNALLGSANLKPSQRKAEDEATAIDGMPFGVGIKAYENTKPIPKPDPEFEDVDGIVRYISIWFLGHLCKMLGIKNTYCKLYEQELEKMRIERPELDDEDDETAFNNIFNDDGEGV